MNHKQRKQRPLLIPAQRDRAPVTEQFKRTEDAELHANAPAGGAQRYPPALIPASTAGGLLPRRSRAAAALAHDPRPDVGASTTTGPPHRGRQEEKAMSQTVPSQHPAVLLRSNYQHLRALLAIAIAVILGLTIAVVVLATSSNRSTTASPTTPSATIPQATVSNYPDAPQP